MAMVGSHFYVSPVVRTIALIGMPFLVMPAGMFGFVPRKGTPPISPRSTTSDYFSDQPPTAPQYDFRHISCRSISPILMAPSPLQLARWYNTAVSPLCRG